MKKQEVLAKEGIHAFPSPWTLPWEWLLKFFNYGPSWLAGGSHGVARGLPCSMCAFPLSSTGLTWELVRNASSWSPAPELLNLNHICAIKFEKLLLLGNSG